MYRCTDCSRLACFGGDAGSAPENCPMRDIAASDEIREELKKLGYNIKDEKNGMVVQKI